MLKQIIKWLFPEPEKKEEIKNLDDHKKFLCSLNIELGFDGIINITCYWPDLEKLDEKSIKLIADQYAKMIFATDSGLLKRDIIDTLYDVHLRNNPYDVFFVQEVLDKWLEYYNKAQAKNTKPLIKPSNVFKQYK
jgi:hypothetical protein